MNYNDATKEAAFALAKAMIHKTLGRVAGGMKKFVSTASKNRKTAIKGYQQSKDAVNLAGQNLAKYQNTNIPKFFEKQVANYRAAKQAKRQQFGNILRSSIGMKPKAPTVTAQVVNVGKKGKVPGSQKLEITKAPVQQQPKTPALPKEPKVSEVKTENVVATGTEASKKYNWKHLAGAGAAGYVIPKLFTSSEPQYPKYASVGTAIGKLLKSIGNAVPSKGAEVVGKTILATGTAGLGTGLVAGYVLGDDGHDADSHGRKKTAQEVVKSKDQGNRTTHIVKVKRPEGIRYYKGESFGANTIMRRSEATHNALLKSKHNPADSTTTKEVEQFKSGEDMTPKEKADQKYAISKSYENEGHPGKAKEYKDKASRAYKRAWEKMHGK